MRFPALCVAGLACMLPACVKHAPPPRAQARATPTPTPALEQQVEVDAKNAVALARDFLKKKGGDTGLNLQDAEEELKNGRDLFRRKLHKEHKDLQPQIDELKRRAAAADAAGKVELDRQIAALEVEASKAGTKLQKLQAAGEDALKAFKARLQEDKKTPDDSTPKKDDSQ